MEKMPEWIGTQPNPFMHLDVAPNRSSAHLAHLGADWEEFYRTKRSSATRRRDRSKLRHMSQFGDVRFAILLDHLIDKQNLESSEERDRFVKDLSKTAAYPKNMDDLLTGGKRDTSQ